MACRILVGEQRCHRLDQAEADHPAAQARCRHFDPILLEARLQRGIDGRAAIHESPVAVEDRETVHRRLALPLTRPRRPPRRSRLRALAAAAALRCGAPEGFGFSAAKASPASCSKPSVARLSARWAGSSAVTSILPPSGPLIRIRRACRWSLRLMPPVRN